MINVIGQGYIGLPTALMFAQSGQEVVGTDLDKKKIEKLQGGHTTFSEKGMDDLFAEAVKKGIRFSTDYQEADCYIISVPTPYDEKNKRVDPTYVIEATKACLDICKKGAIIIIESTVSPGTLHKYIRPIFEEKGFRLGQDVHLVHAPERILPGNMIHELRHNSRTIGAESPEIGDQVKKLYQSFCQGEIVVTDIKTAEMSKVVENTFRDINIAFANELAKICREDGMDVYEIIRIANMHPRVNILQPGPGVGGHCISVDPWFLVGDYPDLTQLVGTARQVNDSMPIYVLHRIHEIMAENGLDDLSQVGIYGLAYKENVDDTRNSPTLQLLNYLVGARVYDPYIEKDLVANQDHSFQEFLDKAKLVVVMLSHDHLKERMEDLKGKLILDTKNIFPQGEGIYKL